jgi:hypothetical protein
MHNSKPTVLLQRFLVLYRKKNEDGFVIRRKEWTKTQKECLTEDTKECRRLCYRKKIDTDTREMFIVVRGNADTDGRGTLVAE